MAHDGSDIVTFGIPLISRAAARDWPTSERLFNATLASLYNQTDPNFRIIVASDGRPTLTVPVDERLEFIDRPRPVPHDYENAQADAGIKRWEIAARHSALGGGNIMFVDADDLVSNKLVEFVRRRRNPNGYIITDGYVINDATGSVAPFPLSFLPKASFHELCATCAVLNLSPADFNVRGDDNQTRYKRIYGRGHHVLLQAMIDEGRPPETIPFRAAVYVLNTGLNMSYTVGHASGPQSDFRTKTTEYTELERVEVTPELRAEFSLPDRAASVPRLSVAVSTYRRPEGLRRLLTALRPQVQGREAREIVVVNDGSHDQRYQRVIDEFKDVILYRPLSGNVGIAKARNASAQLARGEYLVFTDDDCEPPAWWLDWLEARLDHNGELDLIAGTTKAPALARPRFLERVYAHYNFIPHPWSTGRSTLFVTANVAIRRELFWQHGGFGFGEEFPGAGEDSEFASRLARAGARSIADFNWYVCHDVSGTLRRQMRRFWRYGYANVWMTRLTTAPESYVALAVARRRNHWQNAREQFRRALKQSAGFARSRVMRWASAATATLIWSAYYDGCAVAAAARRTELGL
jgi:glycosyltransferase involved in cell wall biosynthesis